MDAVESTSYVPVTQYITNGARQPSKLPCSAATMACVQSWIRDGYRFEVEVRSGEHTGMLTFKLINFMTPNPDGDVVAEVTQGLPEYLQCASPVDRIMLTLTARAEAGRLPPTIISVVQSLSPAQRTTLMARLRHYEDPPEWHPIPCKECGVAEQVHSGRDHAFEYEKA